ncbi:hypothetical protein ACFL12_00210 [Pseudomonadota bacterium]
MPLNLRRTIFSRREIITALMGYAATHDVKMPIPPPEEANVEWEPELHVTLSFLPDASGQIEQLKFDKNEVAAALILYCHRFKEPIPHHSEKALQPYEDGIQFLMRFPWGDEWDTDHLAYNLTFPIMRDTGE